MGTWGPNNFDSDTAADHLCIVTGKLITEIQQAIDSLATLEADEYWGVAVPCNIELLLLIAKQGYVGCLLPEVETVATWRDTYMNVWEESIDALQPKARHKSDRRAALRKTFDELAILAKQHHED